MISNNGFHFLFVAITKTGSEAIRSNLGASRLRGPCVGKDRTYKHPHPDIPYLHPGHYTTLEWRKVLGEEDFNSRFKFAFVRSPWPKLVTHYTDICKHKVDGLLRSDRHKPEKFNEWLSRTLNGHLYRECYRNDPRAKDCDHARSPLWNCIDWITDNDGNVMVDFIGRYETLAEDYKKVIKLIEQKAGKSIPTVLPLRRKNVSNVGYGYQYYYNDKNIELVREYFKKDIEEFGYEY